MLMLMLMLGDRNRDPVRPRMSENYLRTISPSLIEFGAEKKQNESNRKEPRSGELCLVAEWRKEEAQRGREKAGPQEILRQHTPSENDRRIGPADLGR